LIGRERISLEDLLPRLQALTVAYMIHMDGNADFSKGDYRWHTVPSLARRIAENPLWAAAYLKKWQRGQKRDDIPADRAHLYRQYIRVLEENGDVKGGVTMTHARHLTELYRQFYRHARGKLNSNRILRPITIASKAILDADPRLFDTRESLVEVVNGELRGFVDRIKDNQAEGRAWGDPKDRPEAIGAFANYFVGVYWDILGHDPSALRGKQLNLLKNACEVIYRDEESKYWRGRNATPDVQDN
jgi:CRISPR-associated protein Csc3